MCQYGDKEVSNESPKNECNASRNSLTINKYMTTQPRHAIWDDDCQNVINNC